MAYNTVTIKALIDKIKKYCDNNDVYLINIYNIANISSALNESSEDMRKALLYMYHTCDNYFSYNTIFNNNKLYPIEFERSPIDTDVINFLKSIFTYERKGSYPHMKYIYNQFHNSVARETLIAVLKYYDEIAVKNDLYNKNTISYLSIDKNKCDKNVFDTILKYGYAYSSSPDILLWKVYNDEKPTHLDFLFKEYSIDKDTHGTIENNETVVISQEILDQVNNLSEALVTLKEKVGMKPSFEIDKDDFINSIDNLFDKYSNLQDWEKLQKWADMIKEWEAIKGEFFESNN